jgi:hypothetical protein
MNDDLVTIHDDSGFSFTFSKSNMDKLNKEIGTLNPFKIDEKGVLYASPTYKLPKNIPIPQLKIDNQ